MSTTAKDDVSESATARSVAGSSVAVTEAAEDAELSTVGGIEGDADDINNLRVSITKASNANLDISIAGETNNADEDDEEEEEYAAPMHLHAQPKSAKLKGAARSRSSSRSRPSSRRNTPSPEARRVAALAAAALSELVLGSTISPSASVSSSLDGIGDHHHGESKDIIDPDILLDKLGFRDLDPNVTQEELQELLRKHLASNNAGLSTLNERMSEDTLEDTHAFGDLSYTPGKKASASSSMDKVDGEDEIKKAARIEATRRLEMLKSSGLSDSVIMGTMAPLLNTLDEGEEDDEGEDDEGDENSLSAICSGGVVGEADEDVVVEIPDGVVRPKLKNRDTTNSMATLGRISSADDEDDADDDNADVQVPTEVMEELNINEAKRKILHMDTSMMVQTGETPDYLEDDEQDGLEADREEESNEPR